MPRCYNCNSPYHYSDNCPKPSRKKKVTCYNCGQDGHYSDKCNSEGKVNSSNILENINSQHKAEYSNEQAEFTILLDGPWGKKSYFLHPNSEFFKIKKELCNKLLKLKIIKEEDMDIRNQIPHLETDKSEEFENKKINISISSFLIERNLVQIDVGRGKHITMIYKKDIGKQKEVTAVIQSILQPYLKSKEENNTSQCSICMDSNKDVILEPCNHFSICSSCSKRITLPIILKPLIRNFSSSYRKFDEFGQLREEYKNTPNHTVYRKYDEFGQLRKEKIVDNFDSQLNKPQTIFENLPSKNNSQRSFETREKIPNNNQQLINIILDVCLHIWKSDPELRKNVTNYIYKTIDSIKDSFKKLINKEVKRLEEPVSRHNELLKVLNISEKEIITTELLTKKYKEQLIKHHPDVNNDSKESQERTVKIIKAYNELKKK